MIRSLFVKLSRLLQVEKPPIVTPGKWSDWHRETKKARPIAYWLAHTLPKWLSKPRDWFINPFINWYFYCQSRWAMGTHVLRTDLKPGKYHDYEDRLMHGMFHSFVLMIETEFASLAPHSPVVVKRPWWRRLSACISPIRDSKLGLAYLQQEMSLIDPLRIDQRDVRQASSAMEAIVIYTWWTQIRPTRRSIEDESGYTKFMDQMREKYKDREPDMRYSAYTMRKHMTPAESDIHLAILADHRRIVTERHAEDDDMLIRLIKLRRDLWY